MLPLNLGWAVANHLWQSTAAIGIAWMLTFALRRNRGGARYWIWFLASQKLLFPLSLLVALGGCIGSRFSIPLAHAELSPGWTEIAQPFALTVSAGTIVPLAENNPSRGWFLLFAGIWLCGFLFVVTGWVRSWLRVRAVVRHATLWDIKAAVPIAVIAQRVEPGVCGILRPILLLPQEILQRLTPPQLDAIVAHEMAHVRRRDNLTFGFHMVVQALFWFHPLVWWIGKQLIEERELACDEAVLESTRGAEAYAEGILGVCRFVVETPSACISGVCGADLKKRIARVLEGSVGWELDWSRKLLLGAAGLGALGGPLAYGLLSGSHETAPRQADDAHIQVPAFEVATIKVSHMDPRGSGVFLNGRRFEMINSTLETVIGFAYGVHAKQIVGAPVWIEKDQYDINALPEGDTAPDATQWELMMRKLLADRFKLVFHRETREMTVYVLSVDKAGPRLTPSTADPSAPPAVYFHRIGELFGRNAGMGDLAGEMQSAVLDLPVVNQTGLTGRYDFTLKWTPNDAQYFRLGMHAGSSTGAADGPPPPYTAVQEQLGLRIEAKRAKAEVFVVDHLERPTPN